MEQDYKGAKLDTEFVVERVDRPDKNTMDSYVERAQPFVITGMVEDWPAYKNWQDPSYLVQKVGPDHQIPVRTHFTKYQTGTEWLGDGIDLPFSKFMEHWFQKKFWTLEKDKHGEDFYYLASLPMNKHFPSLMDEVIVPPHPLEQKKSGNLWIGNAGQITPVHYDYSTGDPGMDGIHGIILGRKRFRLFNPEGNEEFFPRKHLWGRFHQAVVDVDIGLPNAVNYPQFANAKYIEIDLKAGEALFIPKLWWHHVVTLEPSIAINFWFQHLGSEKLKLGKHWGHMVEYLKAVEKMEITPEKMKNVLHFYGYHKIMDQEVQYYINNPLQFMLLPEFIATFANGTRAPWISSPDAKQFGDDLCDKVKKWILSRLPNDTQKN